MTQDANIIEWEVKEFEKHKRSKAWKIKATSLASLFLLFSFFTSNFLFALIIIIAALIIILNDGQEPSKVRITIGNEGVKIGKKFYDYDLFKDFSLIYKPHKDVKNLYFNFKNTFSHRLSIPLNNTNPLPIHDNLLKYLPEDIERTEEPLSESLAKIFKL